MRVPSGTPSSDITRSISEPLHRSASRCARTCVSCQATVRALGLLRHFPPPAPSQTSLGFLLRSLAGALARPSLLLFPLTQNCCLYPAGLFLCARSHAVRAVCCLSNILLVLCSSITIGFARYSPNCARAVGNSSLRLDTYRSGGCQSRPGSFFADNCASRRKGTMSA